ncbi:MAG: hypothetical protein D6731_08010 [Planctomycetota bacterium]|nr:MAG: hypothetical protein D6731_08010 [Planctomycetota bacterium]
MREGALRGEEHGERALSEAEGRRSSPALLPLLPCERLGPLERSRGDLVRRRGALGESGRGRRLRARGRKVPSGSRRPGAREGIRLGGGRRSAHAPILPGGRARPETAKVLPRESRAGPRLETHRTVGRRPLSYRPNSRR